MSLDVAGLRELEVGIADRIYIQVAKWHLYLGDAGLAKELALECNSKLHQGAGKAARQAVEAVQVPLGNGSNQLPLSQLITPSQINDLEEILTLSQLITPSQINDLEEILDPYCR